MKIASFVLAIVVMAVRAFCDEGLPILVLDHWATLTNTASFRDLHSATNLPPDIQNYVLTVLGSMGVQASDRKRVAEPSEALTADSRLVWAATDGTNYVVVHYEFLSTPDSQRYFINFCVTAALRDPKEGTLKCYNGRYMRRLKDYRDFIDCERHISRRL
jgi:hypothetical protein